MFGNVRSAAIGLLAILNPIALASAEPPQLAQAGWESLGGGGAAPPPSPGAPERGGRPTTPQTPPGTQPGQPSTASPGDAWTNQPTRVVDCGKPTFSLSSRQWRGGYGRNARIDNSRIRMACVGVIAQAANDNRAGFWISAQDGSVYPFDSGADAIGVELSPGDYWFTPNLARGINVANLRVVLNLAPGTEVPLEQLVTGSWTTQAGRGSFSLGRGVFKGNLPEVKVWLVGRPSGKTGVEGNWISATDQRYCGRALHGKYVWGRIRFRFEQSAKHGKTFRADIGICNKAYTHVFSGRKKEGSDAMDMAATSNPFAVPGEAPAQEAPWRSQRQTGGGERFR